MKCQTHGVVAEALAALDAGFEAHMCKPVELVPIIKGLTGHC
jgi:hypothetical protein